MPLSDKFTNFGPVSQVNIMAHPKKSETNPAAVAAECQCWANFHNLPVVLVCESLSGPTFRHTFYPVDPKVKRRKAPSEKVRVERMGGQVRVRMFGHAEGSGEFHTYEKTFGAVQLRRTDEKELEILAVTVEPGAGFVTRMTHSRAVRLMRRIVRLLNSN